MRWPFGPPHLTLKPSKKNTKTQKQTKKKQKKRKKKKTQKKTAQLPKNNFSVISQLFPFLGGFSKFPFFTPWPKKPEPKKHYKNRCFRPFFLKSCCASRNGHFWTKKPKMYKFQLSFFLPIFFSFKDKNTKICWNPYFYSVFANLEKGNFQKNNLKHWKLKKTNFAPLLWKRLFLDNWKITGTKKTQTDNWAPKNHLKPLFL